jgi:hypothetical protein
LIYWISAFTRLVEGSSFVVPVIKIRVFQNRKLHFWKFYNILFVQECKVSSIGKSPQVLSWFGTGRICVDQAVPNFFWFTIIRSSNYSKDLGFGTISNKYFNRQRLYTYNWVKSLGKSMNSFKRASSEIG